MTFVAEYDKRGRLITPENASRSTNFIERRQQQTPKPEPVTAAEMQPADSEILNLSDYLLSFDELDYGSVLTKRSVRFKRKPDGKREKWYLFKRRQQRRWNDSLMSFGSPSVLMDDGEEEINVYEQAKVTDGVSPELAASFGDIEQFFLARAVTV